MFWNIKNGSYMFFMGYADGIVKTFVEMPGEANIYQDWKDESVIKFFFL